MGKSATFFVAALCVALLVAPLAQAQQWPTDLPSPLSRSGQPTIFEEAGVPPVITQGRVKSGDVIAAFPIRYASVGRLKNDVYRTTTFTNSRSLGLAAGTVVFRAQLTKDALDINRRVEGPAYWCGVSTQGKSPQTLCWEEGKASFPAGPARVWIGNPISTSPSPYFPRGRILKDDQEANFPIIELDETARAELPPMELVYVLTKSDRCPAFVEGGIRVAGKVYNLWTLDYGCSQGKKGERSRYMFFSAGDGLVCAYRVGDDGADISVTRQPTRYLHPWDRDVLAEYSAERRAARTPEERAAFGPDCPPPVSK